MTELKKGMRNFSLTGKLRMNNNSFVFDRQKEGSDYVYSSANLMFNCGEGNVFANLIGGHFNSGNNIIYALGTTEDNGKSRTDYSKQLKIPYEKRFDEKILANVSTVSMLVCKVEKDADGKLIEKHFLAKEDAIIYLSTALKNGSVYNVSGDISFRIGTDDKVLATFNIKRIYLLDVEEPKLKATFSLTVLADKDVYDRTTVPDEGGYISLSCYVTEYMKEYKGLHKAIVPLPFTVYMDTKANTNWQKVLTEFVVPHSDNVNEITLDGNIVSIGNVQTIALDEQSKDIQELVKMGLISEDELAKRATNNNSAVSKLVFTTPHIEIKDGVMNVLYDKEKFKASDIFATEQKKADLNVSASTTTGNSSAPADNDAELNEQIEKLFGKN